MIALQQREKCEENEDHSVGGGMRSYFTLRSLG